MLLDEEVTDVVADVLVAVVELVSEVVVVVVNVAVVDELLSEEVLVADVVVSDDELLVPDVLVVVEVEPPELGGLVVGGGLVVVAVLEDDVSVSDVVLVSDVMTELDVAVDVEPPGLACIVPSATDSVHANYEVPTVAVAVDVKLCANSTAICSACDTFESTRGRTSESVLDTESVAVVPESEVEVDAAGVVESEFVEGSDADEVDASELLSVAARLHPWAKL